MVVSLAVCDREQVRLQLQDGVKLRHMMNNSTLAARRVFARFNVSSRPSRKYSHACTKRSVFQLLLHVDFKS